MFTLPADTGLLGQGFFHQGCGIDEHLQVPAKAADHPAGELLQASLDQLVIVIAMSINGNGGGHPVLQDVARVGIGAVVHAKHHRRLCIGPEGLRVVAPGRRIGHPGHFAMMPLAKEFGEAVAGRPGLLHAREPTNLKP